MNNYHKEVLEKISPYLTNDEAEWLKIGLSIYLMKERMIPITCPHCGHVFEIKRDTVVIAQNG